MTCRARTGSLYPGKTCDCSECRPRRLRAFKHTRARGLRVTGREEARAVLDAYLAAGYTAHRVADMTGLHGHNLTRIIDNPGRQIAQHTITSLLSLPMPPPPFILGARRRLRALARLGWGLYDLQVRTGIPRTTLSDLRDGDETARCKNATERLAAIAAVYEQLCMTLAPDDRFHNKTRRNAERKGWPPPLAWDDDTIDDPDATPHMPADHGGHNRRLPDTVTLVAEVNKSGVRTVASRYGVQPKSVAGALKRAGYRAVGGDAYAPPVYRKREDEAA